MYYVVVFQVLLQLQLHSLGNKKSNRMKRVNLALLYASPGLAYREYQIQKNLYCSYTQVSHTLRNKVRFSSKTNAHQNKK